MPGWLVLLILVALAVIGVVIVLVTKRDESRREGQRRRFELRDTGERIPLAPDRVPGTELPNPIKELATPTSAEPAATGAAESPGETVAETILQSAPLEPPQGRFVTGPDGEVLLTQPPFRLRHAVFSKRHGRYAQGLVRRLPPWLAVCPKVRLDTIVAPTSPDGRDPDDWREWRRRVRMRAVDLLLVDRRTWEPLLAIMLERDHPAAATTVAGGKDRIIDEVLATVGLSLIRGTGSIKDDWPAIRPYVEQAMLPSTEDSDREPVLGGAAWDASAVVKLLSFDDERGGLLE